MFWPISRSRAGGADFKKSLLVRIALVAVGCLAAAAYLSVVETRREETARAAAVAQVVGKQLDLQLWRISTGIDLESRFPDWDAVMANLPLAGQCVELRDRKASLVRSHCVGAPTLDHAPPDWFVAVWKPYLGSGIAERPVGIKGAIRGTIVVTSDQVAVADRAWRQMQQLTALTGLIVLVLSVLVYMAIARALAPAAQLISGLEKMQAGDFELRLPQFRLQELDRIGAAANALAAKIEATLGERAELTRRLVNSQEDERRHLARELHDEYGQNLTAIAALAASIETSVGETDPGLAKEARNIGAIAGDMMKALRGTLLRLRPAEIESFGLGEGLRQLVDLWNSSQQSQTRFALTMPTEMGPLPPSTAMHVFRIAQEGLTNAARHAQARHVDLRLESVRPVWSQDARDICLTIEDDGKGRRTQQAASMSGLGLLNMQERVAALGGTIAFEDVPSGGLRVQVVIPAALPPQELRSE